MEVRAPNFEPGEEYLFIYRNNNNRASRIFEFIEQKQGLYIFRLIETRHPGRTPMVPSDPLELRVKRHDLDDLFYITEAHSYPNSAAPAAGGRRKKGKTIYKKPKSKKPKSKKRKNRSIKKY